MENQTDNNLKDEKSSDYLYLEKLQFRPELRKSFLNFFVSNFRVVILLIILLTIIGVYSYSVLPRESQPEVKIPYALVMTTYPGASPADIEELVTKKIETKAAGLKDVKQITSSSVNSISTVTIEFDAKANYDDSIRKLKDKINAVKNDLPSEASEPKVIEISMDDTPILTLSLTGPYDGFTLRDYGEKIKDELEKIPGVREVVVSGGDERELEVAYNPDKLLFYNLSAEQVNQMIRATNLAIPGGNFFGEKFVYPVRADGRFFEAEELANIPLIRTETSGLIYLRDVARVSEKAIKKTVYSRVSIKGSMPQTDVSINVIKKTGGSIVKTTDEALRKVDEIVKTMPGATYTEVTNYGQMVKDNFTQLNHDFLLTILLVFGILFLIVGLKEAIVAGLAVPLVFFATFAVMLWAGISLNFLSVFSLILALGLLVDDAIVVVTATKQYLRTGKFTPEEAVLLVLNDFKVLLTTTTLTTVWAFLPLLLASGIMGSFIKSIPITISVTLIASLIIALMINHPLAAVLERVRLTKKFFFLFIFLILAGGLGALTIKAAALRASLAVLAIFALAVLLEWYFKRGKLILETNAELSEREWQDDEAIKKKLRDQGQGKHENFFGHLIHGLIPFNNVLPTYEKYLRRAIATGKSRMKVLGLALILFLAAIALPATGLVKQEFFPASDYNYIYVDIQAPTGMKLEETDKIARQVEERLIKHKEISSFSTLVGAGLTQSLTSTFGNPSDVASITVHLVGKKDRNIKSYDFAEVLRNDFKEISGADITVESLKGGPPTGVAFEARIAGDDLQTLDKISHDLKPILESIKGVADAKVSLKSSPADYTFMFKPDKLGLHNLNAAQVGSFLRLAIAGVEVTTVIKEGKEIKVRAIVDKEKLPDLDAIKNLEILNTRQQKVRLQDVAEIELKPAVSSISRVDQKRVAVLTAGVRGKTNSATVVKEFQNKLKKEYKLPQGYEIFYGGENEENAESVKSILEAMVLALLLISSTLVIQFNSFRKALIVFIAIPLALIGVFLGLFLTGTSLSFPGLIGVLALFGIVVKNAIILIDKINLNLKTGIPFLEAITDAGKSRLEAIFITSICTIFGIIPITLSDETWQALGVTIIFGLMLSSFLTLFIVPVLFVSLNKREIKKLRN